ncbi:MULTISPECIES: 5-(carboxyamino)imidazole ribonucleotide mutase [Pseudothermotoga]|jgi:5-(carboxyamino)imidazole ribonucleotide mutase|uniref:5-(carboxyamino)imidazole ribonucleotide mutase n=1 Tax=Pseudothermotoga TaxID=1643951 RepID=UPI0004290F77|nr:MULTISPECIES: 5-(carboxyamino)imidazole ribonucleotide mutase [Pseudothermotoga]KUK21857.1 MAG: N5-carboxyaminoimidazole ribonucleotide mutase [Pseudothermotoga lettingae]MDI3494881.1 5-(carboxyamino)imidazole ribonucleotide mutase [Pseudothermotoga sp.]HBJ80425.1 5-(carboxyamino)imidazole ribonucleotide mutase [Pseudothermotoga sp.]HBT25981.1 5-(carboxyamino)imidazole ribonucleotide mutase [Pseudothermotoga sp.]
MKVAIVVGSSSDLEHARQASDTLRIFELAHEIFILSAHRTPLEVMDFAKNAEKEFSVIIAMAGKAAHLPGVIASMTSLPVIGVPLSASISGIDSLFSIVQMPDGIPVATMGVDSAKNAALFAVEILSLNSSKLREKLKEYREDLRRGVLQKNEDFKRGEPQ